MRKCEFTENIDAYLFNRLEAPERDKFEEHYFNCPACFNEIKAREEMIAVIKAKGRDIFPEESIGVPVSEKPRLAKALLAFLSPRQWAVAALSASLVLVAVFGIAPRLKTTTPQFSITDDVVRGTAITQISPVTDRTGLPVEFKWKSAGEDVEYRIYVYRSENEQLTEIWSGTTQETSLLLPAEISSQLGSGVEYSWEVKAFSADGSLIAVSNRSLFQIN